MTTTSDSEVVEEPTGYPATDPRTDADNTATPTPESHLGGLFYYTETPGPGDPAECLESAWLTWGPRR